MIARVIGAIVLAAVIGGAAARAQQPRDSGSGPTTGAAAIRGQIVSDADPPRPIRRAIVTLTGDLPAPRAAITDDDGRFTFANLPAGRYTISAKKAAYLPAAYGAARPGRPGTALPLARDQQATISIRMARGAVLAGTLTDVNGRPAAGVLVTARSAKAAANAPAAESASTDDRGQYRIFGLLPGAYVVSAIPSLRGAGVITSPTTADVDALLAEIARRSSAPAPAAAAAPPAPIPMPARPVALAPVFFPGTIAPAEATPVDVRAGEERSGLDFSLTPTGVATVEGAVSGPILNLGAVQISIAPVGTAPRGLSSWDANPILEVRPTGGDGTFKYSNVTPGRYRIVARADRSQTVPERIDPGVMRAGSGAGVSPAAPNADYLYAIAEFDTRGEDVGGLVLTLQPGGTFSGTMSVDSEAGAPPDEFSKATFRLTPWPSGETSFIQMGETIVGNGFSFQPPMSVDPQGHVSGRNIAPGTYMLTGSMGGGTAGSDGWWLRSAIARGRDLLDEPVVIAPGQAIDGVALTFSNRHSELSGVLSAPSGAPASEYFVLVFSTDRAYWATGSRRVATVRPASDGRFTLRDLPAGTYYVAALDDLEPSDTADAKFLEEVIPAAVQAHVLDGQKTTQDVRIAR